MTALEVQRTIKQLRLDAIERGMPELAITYGWSAIRLGEDEDRPTEAIFKAAALLRRLYDAR